VAIDYVAYSRWSLSDEFFSFLLSVVFIDFVESSNTYPKLRKTYHSEMKNDKVAGISIIKL